MTFVTNNDPRKEDDFGDLEPAALPPQRPATPPPGSSVQGAQQRRGATPPSGPKGRQPTPTPPHPMKAAAAPRRSGRGGCVIAAVFTGLVVVVLVVIGLLLPPFSLLDQLTGPAYTSLDANTPGLAHPDGLTLTIDTAQPGQDFAVALQTLPRDVFLTGTGVEDWVLAARRALPPVLQLKSPIYDIRYRGTPPGAIALQIAVPPDAQPYETMDLYAWNAADGEWEFIPSQLTEDQTTIVTDLDTIPDRVAVFQTGAPAPLVAVPVDVTQGLSSAAAGIANVVMPAGLQPTIQGTLQGSLAANFQVGAGYAVVLTVRNFSDPNALDVSTVEAILNNDLLMAEHVRQLAACVQGCFQGGAADGIAIDYRGIDVRDRDHFSRFIRELARVLHASGRSLTVVVPAAQEIAQGQPWDTGAYDWRAIGRHADTVQILLGNNPVDFVPGGLVERMLRWGVGEISRYKIQLSLSALSFRQVGQDQPSFVPIGFEEAVSGLGNVEVATASQESYFLPGTTIEAMLNGYGATTGFDSNAQTPYIEYEGGAGRIWLTTRAALLYRMSVGRSLNVGGVALRDLMAPGVSPEVFQAAADYVLNSPAPSGQPVELALHWTVLSASGAVVAEATTAVGETFRWDAAGSDGNYAINVAVIGGGQESARAGQQVAVAFPTPTPTLTPTPTPTPTPTATPRPVVQAPVQQPAQQPTQQPAAANPAPVAPSGHIGGSFEIGGHVASLSAPAPDYMRRAGMRWVKVQVRYSLGMSPYDVAGRINEAHGLGFKILLGIVGYPNELASMSEQDYFNQFASFLGGVASLGPDAIEVWNEMNIDREWPQGRIDPAMYVRMLAAAYNAIKAANGNVMVISGALAPTGAEGAFGTDRVWNDDRYYAGMAAAGAAQYADCIGAHYNEGIIPPSQVGGDPRGGYPTYFFTSMIDRAWAPFGGQRPVCFTELGYLSPEGFGPLPGGFAWAANVTVAQQAAWLAEAAVIASNSGKVRLMIVWNVNFTDYGADPMGGYAIIRPGGGCPACDTLGAVAR